MILWQHQGLQGLMAVVGPMPTDLPTVFVGKSVNKKTENKENK